MARGWEAVVRSLAQRTRRTLGSNGHLIPFDLARSMSWDALGMAGGS